MSFVINTTVDKNQELLDAYKDSYECGEKDVFLISRNEKIGIHSFALALSSDFFKLLLSGNQRDVVNIIIPDVSPEILKKVVEYIYIGWISLNSRLMSDFIEACNLLHLNVSHSCERKLVFDKAQKATAIFTAKEPSTTTVPVIAATTSATTTQNNLDSLIDDLEQEQEQEEEEAETMEYHLKQEESSQILEVYEISNIEDTDITYAEDNEDMSEERYEIVNVISEAKSDTVYAQEVKKERVKKDKSESFSDIKSRTPPKPVDEDTMNKAIKEIFSNSSSFRTVSEKYQVPKTLLWRRAKKMGYVKGEKMKDSSRILAIEAIKQGESLISLSKKFNIPISTLHREKLKLYEKGQLPENVNLKNRSRGEDYEDRLRIAISEILNGKSQNEIAKKHNIPKTTIWRIIKKMSPTYKATERNVITPESEIVDHLLKLSKRRSIKEDVLDESALTPKEEQNYSIIVEQGDRQEDVIL